MKQWNGSEYWVACRQLIPVVTLLLIKDDSAILQYIQAIIDFVHMAQYKSHTNSTLYYIKYALYQIYQTKRAFRDTCQTDTMIREGKNEHFNFLKWHVISHYPEWIKRYRSITGFITGIEEIMHITWIKDFFKRTNIKKGYKRQILDYNIEKFSLMVRDDIDLFSSTKILTQANENAPLQVNSMSDAKIIKKELKWYIEKSERLKLGYSRLNCNY